MGLAEGPQAWSMAYLAWTTAVEWAIFMTNHDEA
jgi:hypothetical protein